MRKSGKILNRLRRALGIVSPSRVFMQEAPQQHHPLRIAFLAWDLKAADRYMEQLVADNADQVKRYILRHTVILTDGTEICRVCTSDPVTLHGRRYDQVIIADDRRMEIMQRHRATLRALDWCCSGSIVPEEYRWQIYDLDAEVPENG